MTYNLSKIRTFLTEGFTTEKLRHFCYDQSDFRPVYNRLAPNTGKNEIIDRLLEHAEQKYFIELLLLWAKEHNPAKYRKYEPYHNTPSPASPQASAVSQNPQEIVSTVSHSGGSHPTLDAAQQQQGPIPVDFVILTPLEEERDALLSKLPNPRKLDPIEDDIHVYFEADVPITSGNGSYRIIVMPLLGMGRVQAATAANDAIRRWNPRYVILFGIAGGVQANHIRLGDVVIADKIVDYELQKQTAEGVDIRWEVYNVSPRLLGAAKNFMDQSWKNLINIKRPLRGQPKRHIGPIASGDKVVDFAKALEKYRETWSKLIGIEMEAGGVAVSTFQAAKQTEFFMIRGVSDLADGDKNSPQVKKWRLYACEMAASYTIALLQNRPVPFDRPTPPTRDIVLYELCLWEEGSCIKKFSLRWGKTYLIGRSEVCQLWIPTKYDLVSRRHARIKLIEDKVILLDGDGATPSKFGTYVNGVSVDDKQGRVLNHGDRIILGKLDNAEKQNISEGSCLLTFELQT